MAIIPQKQLFSWKEIENLGDLSRLRLVLDYLPDEPLMHALESQRAKGRDEYPVRAVWNSILAGIVFQHNSVESLRRELKRNDRLRWLCGFDIAKGENAVPPSWVYTRFFALLFKNAEYIEKIFEPFFTTKDNWDGQGLGLSVAFRIVEQHHGTIRAESERGKGTTIHIVLPIAQVGTYLV